MAITVVYGDNSSETVFYINGAPSGCVERTVPINTTKTIRDQTTYTLGLWDQVRKETSNVISRKTHSNKPNRKTKQKYSQCTRCKGHKTVKRKICTLCFGHGVI
jgi:hypothetical protein